MTPRRAEKSQVPRKKRYLLGRMQKPEDLLLIIPLRPPHFKPDLPKVNPVVAEAAPPGLRGCCGPE